MTTTDGAMKTELLETRYYEESTYFLLSARFHAMEYFLIVIEEAEESAMALFGSDRSLAERWFGTAASEGLAAIHLGDYAKDCAYEAEFF